MYEKSVTDLKEQSLKMVSRNLTYSNLITVEEICSYRANESNPNGTVFSQEVKVNSFNAISQIRNMIEDFCVSQFMSNAAKGRLALEQVLERLYKEASDAEFFITNKLN
jgi:hypothetical protein